MKEDDNNWPAPDRVGKQELEIIINGQHISFTCTKLGSVLQVQQSKDPEGLKVFYYLVQVRAGMLGAAGPRKVHGTPRPPPTHAPAPARPAACRTSSAWCSPS